MQFLKDSFREIKHVAWPTKQETKKYFTIVVSVLVVFGIYVFLAGSIFTNIIFFFKDLIK